MKIKIIGFKVGVARPTYNKTIDIGEPTQTSVDVVKLAHVGVTLVKALMRSDFLSVRKVS